MKLADDAAETGNPETVAPAGNPLAVNVTEPDEPAPQVIVVRYAPVVPPCRTLCEEGETESVKLGAVTTSVALTV